MLLPLGRIADFKFALGHGLFNLHAGMRVNVTTGRRDRGIFFGDAVFVAERGPEEAE